MDDELLIRFIEHRCTAEETAGIIRWINASAANRKYYHKLQLTWAAAEIATSMNNEQPDRQSVEQIMRAAGIQQRTFYNKAALVAGAVTLIGVAAALCFFFFLPIQPDALSDYKSTLAGVAAGQDIELTLNDGRKVSLSDTSAVINYTTQGQVVIHEDTVKSEATTIPVLNTVRVPYGKRTRLTLADGSIVHLNSGSSLVYPAVFDTRRREVYLEGEAFFEVSKEAGRPFVVQTEYKAVRVLGTRFNVLADLELHTFETVLVNGSVTLNGEDGTVKLMPNQHYGFSAETRSEEVKMVNVERYISWVEGRMLFEQESLRTVLRKLEKVYNIRIHLLNPLYADYLVSGNLNLKDTSTETLDMLMQIFVPDYHPDTQPMYRIE